MHKSSHSRLRTLRTWRLGEEDKLQDAESLTNLQPLLDLASNDYLGLKRHSDIIEAANKAMHAEGVGSGGSRFITGTRPIHKSLEKELGKWLGYEHVLLFPSGFQANLAAVIALANRHTPVIVDKYIHHSILVAIKASGAKLIRFPHNNSTALEKCLQDCSQKHKNNAPLVIVESVYSMEGTSPNLRKVIELCDNYSAQLIVDEAHALGVVGPEGKGLCFGLSEKISILSGTFGKAFGSGGAFLASNKRVGEHLIQTSGAFRYTTALAPPLAAASLAALKLIKNNPHWPIDLQKKSQLWREKLQNHGWECPDGESPILSVLLGSDEKALNYQNKLEKKGLLSIAIRPPTVPEGTSRLRLVLRRNIPNDTLSRLIDALVSE